MQVIKQARSKALEYNFRTAELGGGGGGVFSAPGTPEESLPAGAVVANIDCKALGLREEPGQGCTQE